MTACKQLTGTTPGVPGMATGTGNSLVKSIRQSKRLRLHIPVAFRDRDEFLEVISAGEGVQRRPKLEGAAVGLLNGAIIARDLGRADNQREGVWGAVRASACARGKILARGEL
jgi:hypothetical protein